MSYAIVFDLDTEVLKKTYRNESFPNAYSDIKKILVNYGFEHQQGSTYFGNDKVDAVTCVLAVQEISSTYDWFAPSVQDIRMLRIEDNNDLRPAVERAKSIGKN